MLGKESFMLPSHSQRDICADSHMRVRDSTKRILVAFGLPNTKIDRYTVSVEARLIESKAVSKEIGKLLGSAFGPEVPWPWSWAPSYSEANRACFQRQAFRVLRSHINSSRAPAVCAAGRLENTQYPPTGAQRESHSHSRARAPKPRKGGRSSSVSKRLDSRSIQISRQTLGGLPSL